MPSMGLNTLAPKILEQNLNQLSIMRRRGKSRGRKSYGRRKSSKKRLSKTYRMPRGGIRL